MTMSHSARVERGTIAVNRRGGYYPSIVCRQTGQVLWTPDAPYQTYELARDAALRVQENARAYNRAVVYG